jgi:cellulose synthase/poly-beta-1,6-N-acetylglucosamine synthase-like glycosyltransferase
LTITGHPIHTTESEAKQAGLAAKWSAQHTLSKGQRAAGIALFAITASGFAIAPAAAGTIVVLLFTLSFLASTGYRIACYRKGYRRLERGHAAPLPDALPSYTVMTALYREANVVPELLDALNALEYPRDRLEVLLIVEEDDPDTEEACRANLRDGWRVIVVPPGHPKTKPRALNVALEEATGELLTIYDAEDRPAPGQLIAAAGAFAVGAPELAAVQARLDFYNEDDNLLTRWFACEYATHFGLYLEGVAAYGHPVPLGGTSTHIRTSAVRAVGGWDSWNVTEDCELGMRFAASGLRVDTLDSVTGEEAVPKLRPWIRQRSRWIKGYTQSSLVMLRSPVATARAMGVREYAAALAGVACTPIVLLAQPVFWATLWGYIILRGAGVDVTPIERLFPGPLGTLAIASLLFGNFAVVLAHVAVLYERRRYSLVRYAVFIPVYWALTSVGAWVGVTQLLYRPHFWAKTTHGQSARAQAEATPAPERTVV